MAPDTLARRSHALQLASRAFAAGARTSTVRFLTGLDRGVLRRHVTFELGAAPKPGKRPDSAERFIKNAGAATMLDASLAYVLYRDHRARLLLPAEALVTSYEHYALRRGAHALRFDRVFYIVCWTDCLWEWIGREPIFQLVTCTLCHCHYLALPAAAPDHERECPFCKVRRRYARDARLRGHFAEQKVIHIGSRLPGSVEHGSASLDGQPRK